MSLDGQGLQILDKSGVNDSKFFIRYGRFGQIS